ncbi:amidohydrolase [Arthrobacter sp. Sa2CUA1]|uniref:Amidohydrolase n=1 Tax=Arthrobacter gallicola TaxID=2762225 RepID=A0ABR8UV93_9MICC|nr:amidohydrolase [Arthrobacter gallicola]MBD7996448.1 amidohydrolase [Arthrobacter gallicola]
MTAPTENAGSDASPGSAAGSPAAAFLTSLGYTTEDQQKLHETYRYLHAHPELSMQEHETAAYLLGRLQELGLEAFACGGTGIVGILRNGDGPVVGYRADTDGLPIGENTGLEYASAATGTLEDGTAVPVMHGCGHDTHMAVALTTAELLARSTDRWAGTVVFIFQPGEETAAGARAMVADGLWGKAPRPEVIYGQHVWPSAAGEVEISSGTAMAMADSWRITVLGRQAHGSQPEKSIDPILLGAHMVVRIQTIISREVPARDSAVITVGTFHGGLKENIIPGSAEFTVNVRTFEPEVREHVLGALRRIIAAEAAASGAPEPLIEEISSFPRCYNDPETTAGLLPGLRRALGEQNVKEVPPVMGSEDFGLLADAIGVPSVYWMFGSAKQKRVDAGEPVAGNHSPEFAPELEPTLGTGLAAALAALTTRLDAG